MQKCLESFYDDLVKNNFLEFEVWIIENGSQKSPPEFLKNRPRAHWYNPGENLGYGKGNNLGYKLSSGRTVLVLNPDVQISAKAIVQLYNEHQKQHGKVISSCKLLYPNGKIQENRIFSYDHLRNAVNRNVILEKMKIRFPEKTSKVPLGFVGALLLFNREIIKDNTIFDPCFFMYDEETEFCRRMFKTGCRFNYLEQVNAEHATEGTITNSEWMYRQKAVSRMQYIRKSFSFIYFISYFTVVVLNILSLLVTYPFQRHNSNLKKQLSVHLSQFPNYIRLILRPEIEYRIQNK